MNITKINEFLTTATQEELLAFFAFDTEPTNIIIFKFDRWARMFFPEYFKYPTAPFHYEMVTNYAESYLHNQSTVALGFRGCAKSSLAKLFVAFAILNDQQSRKKYIKVLTKDLRNSKKTVTDIFNMLVTVKNLYGEIFIVDKETKQEETMSTFQIKSNDNKGNIQINAGTVGQQHRGHLQGANRPDWLCHEKGTMIFDKEWMPVEAHPNMLGIRNEKGIEVKLNSLPHSEVVTNEHRYWAKLIKKNSFQKSEDMGDGWVEAQHLTKRHYIGLPIETKVIPIPELPVYYPEILRNEKGQILSATSTLKNKQIKDLEDPEWWWFIGLFWGDGNLAGKKERGENSSSVIVTIADSQPHIKDRVVDLLTKYNRKYTVVQKVGCCQIVFSYAVLARFLRTWYTGGNSQKRPPQWVEYIDPKLQEQLVKGYIDADGYIDQKGRSVRVTSVSLWGLYALRRILARLGVASSIRKGVRAHKEIIKGILCNIQDKYDLRFTNGLGYSFPQTRYAYTRTFIQDGYLWTKVHYTRPSEETEFVPITTDDHTYLTHFGKSHNCFDDIEDKESIRSIIITQGIIDRCDEALSGMATNGSYIVLGNYISKSGIIQWFLNKSVTRIIQPLLNEEEQSTWPEAFTPEVIEKCKENTNDWWGEYGQDPERSENSYFDLQKLNEAFQTAKQPFKVFQGVKYWNSYEPGHRYGIGADIGEGSGKDASTIVLYDFTTGETVATYVNNTIQPNMFASEITRLGHEFGNCIIAPERNNNGVAVIENIRDYPAVYQEVTSGRRSIRRTDRMGWYTSKKSKPMMFDEFRRDFNKGEMKIYDVDLLKEMRSFSYGDVTSSDTALVTRHSDLLTGAAIAWQMRKHAVMIDTDYVFEEEEPLFADIGV